MRIGICAGLAILVIGCTAGTGTVDVTASGETAAVTGYPATLPGGEVLAFADGWTLRFTKVLVSVADFHLKSRDGARVALEEGHAIVDLHQGPQEILSYPGVPARRWDDTGYDLVPATATARKVGTIADSDVQRMVTGRFAIYLEGTARKEGETVDYTLQLGIPMRVDGERCVSGRDETDGIVVAANTTTEAELTIHLDHFFFDSAVAEEPALRFEPYAASAGPDRVITFATLATQDLTQLRDRAGAAIPVAYDPGSTPTPVRTLQDYVLNQAVGIPHFNGEGHCEYVGARVN